jgi:C-terminal processing protease CtpA/Prc
MKTLTQLCLLALFLLDASLNTVGGQEATEPSSMGQTIKNLRAFAKLYGYVKYFHPSDEANTIDWDKFAVYGAKQVENAKDTEELKTALETLVLPIAPTIQIYTSGQKPDDPTKQVPNDTNDLKIVAWQHVGVGGSRSSVYKSIRTNRENKIHVGGPPSSENIEIFSGTLFEKHPKIGEVVNKRLADSLSCQIPLALYSDASGTLGKDERHPFTQLAQELDGMSIGELTADDEYLRLGDVVIAWNVFQHFYPYFDVVNVDWDLELTRAFRKAITDENERDFHYTLCRLAARLQDGHGMVGHKVLRERMGLPFQVDWIEDQVVVTASGTAQVHTGDIIVSIDDTKAKQALLDVEEYVSGSPQCRSFKALQRFGSGEKGTRANLVIKRKGEICQIQVERRGRRRGTELKRPEIDRVQDDVYYVDLTRVQMKKVEDIIHDIAQAKGVVFDLRGYPRGSIDFLICHLLREKDTSNAWMRVPQIIYPDQENIVGYKNYGWGLEPREPRIKGKVVFLTNPRAISAAESYLSFVEHYKLGEIVGQPTAGTNGNVNRLTLPGGYMILWTGMKVLKHDGSQHHLIGVQPTVPVQRTIQGVIEGRDEYLEKALEIINQQAGR